MAANNYFGFTHGGTQYGAASAAAYQAAQPGYAVAPAATATTYSPQRAAAAAAGYENAYQTAAAAAPPTYTGTAAPPASYDYGYGTAAQTAYTAKTYYQQPTAAAAAAAAAAVYSTTETHYQATKPAYSNTSTYSAPARQPAPGLPKATGYSASYTGQPSQQNAVSYSSGYNSSPVLHAQSGAKANYHTNQVNSNAATFTTNYSGTAVQNHQNQQKQKSANTSYTNYDAAVYSAATLYATQQSTSTPVGASGGIASVSGSGVPSSGVNVMNKLSSQSVPTSSLTGSSPSPWQNNYRKGPVSGGLKQPYRQKQPPKQQQVHYCDVCKISCAGPQTYREHLDGQKHKKKEVMLKSGSTADNSQNALKCELCDVKCTGSDAYAAHIRGARHQKVVKLHTRLGKPIPSTEPVVQGKGGGTSKSKTSSNSGSGTRAKKPTPSTTIAEASPKTPKITFNPTGNVATPMPGSSVAADLKEDDDVDKDVQPVGEDYIEEIKNEEGKSTTFMCKLCDCRFNDPNAKEMHMKGRRHRLQYKKKVNPELVVEAKPSLRQRKGLEDKQRRMHFRDDFMRRREEDRMMRGSFIEEDERMFWEERRRYEEEMEYFEWCRRYGRDPRALGPPPPRPFGPPGPGLPGMIPPFFPQPPMMRRQDSLEDRHVLVRHSDICPEEDELAAVHKIVSHTEKALNLVSDQLAEASQNASAKPGAAKPAPVVKPAQATTPAQPAPPTAAKPSPSAKMPVKKEDGSDGNSFSFQQGKEDDSSDTRVLKAVVRVGVFAKGLLLHGDTSVNLVMLCAEKPTRTLLYKISENLPKQLQTVAPDDKYSVKCIPEEAAVEVIGAKEPHITVTITLTSFVMREPLVVPTEITGDSAQATIVKVKEPPDVLDKQKCLEALAALRHAKWFQARATQLPSCVLIIRILRDLCQRVPTWAPLHSWAMELLVEKVLSASQIPLTPGEALRRVIEALASGIMLPGGPGFLDPCEKEPIDAAGSLNAQQREDITASAQHALRLLAFRQVHKVLGMEQLPPHKFNRGRFGTRKRRREGSGEESNDSEAVDGKKDKKEDEVEMDTEK